MPRRWLTAMLAALVMTPLILPAAASAQASGAFLDGAEPWIASDCAGDVPIVVGADAKAQSDIYSAVTLAGVVDTDCVILAGPRDGDMTAAQQARLDAAAEDGYVVGGTAAVPDAKLAGRDMTRLGGATRWATAQQVGSEASALAAGTEPETATAPDTTLTAPGDVTAPGLYLDGAEPWIASECAGDTPIVVGADSKAQSDIYSAVTLAGVLDTDCVILAGLRTGDMPASQRARLEDAEPGGYVLGGIAAVPTAKIAGRDMTRLGGGTRWATAELVGRRASGDTTAGTPTATETNDDATASSTPQFTAVSVGSAHSCGLRSDATAVCWGDNWFGQADAPSGSFTAVSAGVHHSCGVRSDATAVCWGDNSGSKADAPSGSFTAVSAGDIHSCGLRTNGTVTCWGVNYAGRADAPSGSFTAVSAGGHSCGVRSDATAVCWGDDSFDGRADAPSGSFTAVSAGSHHSCGLRTNGTVTCWGANGFYDDEDGVRGDFIVDGRADAPSGSFTAVSAGSHHSCGLRTNGTVACWGANWTGEADAPSGSFTAVSAGGHSCGVRSDATVACWGANWAGQADAPS